MKGTLDRGKQCEIDFRTEPDYCLPLIPPGNNLDNLIISKSDINKLDKNALPPS